MGAVVAGWRLIIGLHFAIQISEWGIESPFRSHDYFGQNAHDPRAIPIRLSPAGDFAFGQSV